MSKHPERATNRPFAAWVAPTLLGLVPWAGLGIIWWFNSLGTWPAFRQQDTSILHWNLTNYPRILKGLSHEDQAEGVKASWRLPNLLRDYLTLENLNLSGFDLTSSDLSEMSIENVSFAGASLANANFSCSDLNHVDFSGAQLVNSRFDYSGCQHHASTRDLKCSQKDSYVLRHVSWPNEIAKADTQPKFICLEGRFVGANFANAQIRGALNGKEKGKDKAAKDSCRSLLILVGEMSGATFREARLSCVALIHRPITPKSLIEKFMDWLNLLLISQQSEEGRATANKPDQFSFNGISFDKARLHRVALVQGPFRFSQFERAELKGLFLNIAPGKADLNYSMLNEIECKEERDKKKSELCLIVPAEMASKRDEPLNLNLLWSKVVTNLEPTEKDHFLCTPVQDLPAWVEGLYVEYADYNLILPSGSPTQKVQCVLETHLLKMNSPLTSPLSATGR